MTEYHCLPPNELSRFLERYKAALVPDLDVDLDELLSEILRNANEFVPSEAGSILLDDPQTKTRARAGNELRFIATFGEGSDVLLGRPLSASEGIAGQVYTKEQPYLSEDVATDRHFFSKIDKEFGFQARSIVCVPIYFGKSVCGVIELINRKDGERYTEKDKLLLEIFAGYTSFTFQSALDARRAHELAKRDDLTGLYNDRWLHFCLSQHLGEAIADGSSTGLIFLDLDNFKQVNDLHGHLAGSQVLREVGFILNQTIKTSATISRYGGDEFVIILPDTTIEAARKVASKVGNVIADHTFLEESYGEVPALGINGVISASVGLAIQEAPSGASEVDAAKNELLRNADQAMYAAKTAGKGCVYIHREGVLPVAG
ncbi:MAG: sensor domain-containing diguanylate cyclase [Thermoanaerobaculia bacterium]|nr:sensor domain-containing diguanylate cyclase [Thermoanaerobaculia bacterium]